MKRLHEKENGQNVLERNLYYTPLLASMHESTSMISPTADMKIQRSVSRLENRIHLHKIPSEVQ